jgi:hypothetical protein
MPDFEEMDSDANTKIFQKGLRGLIWGLPLIVIFCPIVALNLFKPAWLIRFAWMSSLSIYFQMVCLIAGITRRGTGFREGALLYKMGYTKEKADFTFRMVLLTLGIIMGIVVYPPAIKDVMAIKRGGGAVSSYRQGNSHKRQWVLDYFRCHGGF